MAVKRKRPGVGAWIVDDHVEIHVTKINSPVALSHMHLFGMRMSGGIKPGLVVESHGIHNQHVSIPLSNGVAEPARFQVFGMTTPIHEDLAVAVDVPFMQEEDERRSLH